MNTAGLGSSQQSAPQPNLNFPPVQISSELSTERGITDKTVEITDRGRGRNYPSRQAGKKLCSGRFFPWPNISVCKKFEHIHSKAQW